MFLTDINERKAEHIRIALQEKSQFKSKHAGFGDVGFEGVELVYNALPEISKADTDTKTSFLGKKFSAPIMVAAITGGYKEAERINKDIAKACEVLGVGMCLGSQRAMIEQPALAKTYQVRDAAPNIFLGGNIGVVQAKDYSIEQIDRALENVGADALFLHINAAQEAVQAEGTTNFTSCIKTIDALSRRLSKPVIVKEVGHGISSETAASIAKTSAAAIDVGGAGGTSWVAIDAIRNRNSNRAYWEFGIPTAASILEVKSVFRRPVIATGGIRSGLDVVKAIVLGADLCGMAQPVLKAWHKGKSKGVQAYLVGIIEEIRTGMFVVGAKNLAELKRKKYVLSGRTREWIEQRKN